jgi:hypothetical protein
MLAIAILFNTSQRVMRWRVVLQFIALCLVMAALYLSGKY